MKKPACAGLFHDSPCGPSTCHQALIKHVLEAASNASPIFAARKSRKLALPAADTGAWEREAVYEAVVVSLVRARLEKARSV
jgi:hypothetical protein